MHHDTSQKMKPKMSLAVDVNDAQTGKGKNGENGGVVPVYTS